MNLSGSCRCSTIPHLEEAGNGLSGGEKQRIALARALLKENQFYITDKSTGNLDFATENLIFDMIYNRFKSKTMLIIAHRLSTVKNCDLIIVMDGGTIMEMCYDGTLVMPGGYALMDEEEMCYTEGGVHISATIVQTICRVATLGITAASYVKAYGMPKAITLIGGKIVSLASTVLTTIMTIVGPLLVAGMDIALLVMSLSHNGTVGTSVPVIILTGTACLSWGIQNILKLMQRTKQPDGNLDEQ